MHFLRETHAFSSCSNLQTLPNFPSTLTNIRGAAFANCEKLLLIPDFPDGLERIESAAFLLNKSLVVVPSFGRCLKHIGDNAFSGCENVSLVEIPPWVTYVSPTAFYGCTLLEAKSKVVNMDVISYLRSVWQLKALKYSVLLSRDRVTSSVAIAGRNSYEILNVNRDILKGSLNGILAWKMIKDEHLWKEY